MDDRELLELAAKAAGARMTDYSDKTPDHWEIVKPSGVWGYWNPLTDDGDALRLAVKLRMDLEIGITGCFACTETEGATEYYKDDPYAATRIAIVRAAAEIGRAM